MKFWLTFIGFVASSAVAISLLAWSGLPYSPIGTFSFGSPIPYGYGYVPPPPPPPAPAHAVEGNLLLQGRGPANHAGTTVVVLQGETIVNSAFTDPQGRFHIDLAHGAYRFTAGHPGWVPRTRHFIIDESSVTDVGITVLPAGDADADGDVDFFDLRLFQVSLHQPPPATTRCSPPTSCRFSGSEPQLPTATRPSPSTPTDLAPRDGQAASKRGRFRPGSGI